MVQEKVERENTLSKPVQDKSDTPKAVHSFLLDPRQQLTLEEHRQKHEKVTPDWRNNNVLKSIKARSQMQSQLQTVDNQASMVEQSSHTSELSFDKKSQKLAMAGSQKAEDPQSQGKDVRQIGVAFAEAGVDLRSQPSTNSSSAIVGKLAIGTKIFIDKEVPGGWYFVTLSTSQYGYVNAKQINTRLPEPRAKLYKVKHGESAYTIARDNYGKFVQSGRDLRFYVNVLEELNRGGGIQRSSGGSWEDTKALENFYIWIPSAEYANTFVGKVLSGSHVRDALAFAEKAAKTVVDVGIGSAAFTAGILHGGLESVWNALVGIKDLIVMVWDIVKSLVTGNLLNDTKNLWNGIISINWGDLTQGWMANFQKRWNEPDLLKKWHFRGWVFGYAAAEIAMTVLTFGGLTGARWFGKMSTKAIQVLNKIPGVARLVAVAKKIPVPEGVKKVLQQGYRQLRQVQLKPQLQAKIAKATKGNKALKEEMLQLVQNVFNNKKIEGFSEWMEFVVNTLNKQDHDLLFTLKELKTAINLSSEIGGDEVLKISTDFANQASKSFDIHVVNKSGKILREVEVKTLKDLVNNVGDFTTGVKHGIEKAKNLPSGMGVTREVHIYADFPTSYVKSGNYRLKFTPNGKFQMFTKDGTRRIKDGDVIQEFVQNVPKIKDSNLLTNVNVYSKTDNKIIALLENQGGTWVIKTRRR